MMRDQVRWRSVERSGGVPAAASRADGLLAAGFGCVGLIFAVRVAWVLLTQAPSFADWRPIDAPLLELLWTTFAGAADDVIRPVPALLLKGTWVASGGSATPFAVLVVLAHIGGAATTARAFRAMGLPAVAAALGAVATLATDTTALSAVCLTYHQAAFAKLFAALVIWEFVGANTPRAWIWVPSTLLGALSSEQFFALGPLLLCCLSYQHGLNGALGSFFRRPLSGFTSLFCALFAARVLWQIYVLVPAPHIVNHPLTAADVPVMLLKHLHLTSFTFGLQRSETSLWWLCWLAVFEGVRRIGVGAAARVVVWTGAWWIASILPNLPTSATPSPYNVLMTVQGAATGLIALALAPARRAVPAVLAHPWGPLSNAAVLATLLVPLHAQFLRPLETRDLSPAVMLPRIYKRTVAANPGEPVRMIVVDQDTETSAPCPQPDVLGWDFELGAGSTRNEAFAVVADTLHSETRAIRAHVPEWFCVRPTDTLVMLRRSASPPVQEWARGFAYEGWEYVQREPCADTLPAHVTDGASASERAYIEAYLSDDDDAASVLALEVLRSEGELTRARQDLLDWVWATAPQRLSATPPFAHAGPDDGGHPVHVLWVAGEGPGTRMRCDSGTERSLQAPP